jgi:hypothetical protein
MKKRKDEEQPQEVATQKRDLAQECLDELQKQEQAKLYNAYYTQIQFLKQFVELLIEKKINELKLKN